MTGKRCVAVIEVVLCLLCPVRVCISRTEKDQTLNLEAHRFRILVAGNRAVFVKCPFFV